MSARVSDEKLREMETWPNPSAVSVAKELRALRAHVAERNARPCVCTFCGAQCHRDDAEHELKCEKHPMRAVEKERDAAQGSLRAMERQHDSQLDRAKGAEAERDRLRFDIGVLAGCNANQLGQITELQRERDALAARLRELDVEPRPLREGDSVETKGGYVFAWPLSVECSLTPVHRLVRVPIAAAPESAPAEKAEKWVPRLTGHLEGMALAKASWVQEIEDRVTCLERGHILKDRLSPNLQTCSRCRQEVKP